MLKEWKVLLAGGRVLQVVEITMAAVPITKNTCVAVLLSHVCAVKFLTVIV